MSQDATPHAENVRFVDACIPRLDAGEYCLYVMQSVGSKDEVWKNYESELRFGVETHPFCLNPEDIHSVHPPANQSGSFDCSLPHVVFTRRTLPWERALVPGEQSDPPLPWMALILLQEEELCSDEQEESGKAGTPARAIVRRVPISGGADSLRKPLNADVTVVPTLGERDWDVNAGQTSCQVLDLPGPLARALLPKLEDLPYLAHGREVTTDSKEVQAINDQGWFSVVIGNRLPNANQSHRAFLVSLEGHQTHLAKLFDAGKSEQFFRLVVLGSWAFKCEQQNAKSGLSVLEGGPLNVPWNQKNSKEPGDNSAECLVRAAYDRGYTAFNHAMRHGEKTVSWFRGPLVPLRYEMPRQIESMVTCADGLMQYDPTWGMFDTTYAAAWQLGRLLALQNQSFAIALDRTRRRFRARARRVLRAKELEQQLTTQGVNVDWMGLQRNLERVDDTRGSTVGNESSVEVTLWLGRLVLLYGVPFNYLVPDESMLPQPSLRFFYLDPVWIQCLVQGACSIGSDGRYGDVIVDAAMKEWSQSTQSDGALGGAHRKAACERDRLRLEHEGVEARDGREGLNWPLTGFLLRSPVVEGWRGLEMVAYRGDSVPLQPLRLEQLSRDVMLGIFNGQLEKLVIRQPQEGLHFGFSRADSDSVEKKLRDLATGECTGKTVTEKRMRTQAPDTPSEPLQQRALPSRRVLDVSALAKALATNFKHKSEIRTLSSAEFAVQMVEAAGNFTFTRGK